MALDAFLLDLLQDPVDRGPLLYVPSKDVLYNERLGVAYEVRDSIPVLLPDESHPVTKTEANRYHKDPDARLTGPQS